MNSMNTKRARWSAGAGAGASVVCLCVCAILALILSGGSSAAGTEADASATRTQSRFVLSPLASTALRLRGSRALEGTTTTTTTITTPNCSAIRTSPYPAELQLFYTYSVEIKDDLLLSDMERALENALAIELDMCDVNGRPVYKVRTGTRHSFSTSGTCDPVADGNTCIVVNGESAIFLDRSSDATFVRNRAYTGISHALADSAFLDGFSSAVVSAELLSEGHASLVENSDYYYDSLDASNNSYRSGITTTVAVAAASVTIVVASIFFYGFLRKAPSDDPSVRHKKPRKFGPRTIVSGSPRSVGIGIGVGVPARHHFVRLEDLSAAPSSFLTASLSPQSEPSGCVPHYIRKEYSNDGDDDDDSTNSENNPGVSWSVSDITSDSASLRSVVSRTPSTLERIDEEEIEDGEENSLDDDGIRSCNFSYSEDSTMITNSLSRAGILVRDDPVQNPTSVTQYDCASERRDRVLDISDLDACFTILPDDHDHGNDNDNDSSNDHDSNNDHRDVFCDLDDDLSSDYEYCTQESRSNGPLKSILLDMEISSGESDCDCDCEENSFQASLSDTSVVSMVPLGDPAQADPMEDSIHNLSIYYAMGRDSGCEISKPSASASDDSKPPSSTTTTMEEHPNSGMPDSMNPPEPEENESCLCATTTTTTTTIENNSVRLHAPVCATDSDADEAIVEDVTLSTPGSKGNDKGDDVRTEDARLPTQCSNSNDDDDDGDDLHPVAESSTSKSSPETETEPEPRGSSVGDLSRASTSTLTHASTRASTLDDSLLHTSTSEQECEASSEAAANNNNNNNNSTDSGVSNENTPSTSPRCVETEESEIAIEIAIANNSIHSHTGC